MLFLIFYKIWTTIYYYIGVFLFNKLHVISVSQVPTKFSLLCLKGMSLSSKHGLVYANNKINSNNNVILDFIIENIPPMDLYTLIAAIICISFSSWLTYYLFVLPVILRNQKEQLICDQAELLVERIWGIKFDEALFEMVTKVSHEQGNAWALNEKTTNFFCAWIAKSHFLGTFPGT